MNPPYLTDGSWTMSTVLNNIKFANCVRNNGTIAAVAPGKPAANAPIGQTIWLQGNNGLFVSSENGTQAMNCNRAAAQGWEQFYVGDAGNGKVTLQSMGKYVSSENAEQAMTCNRAVAQGWEQFDWFDNGDGTISLRSSNGMFVSSENGEKPMNCNRAAIDGWEKFRFGTVSGARLTTVQTQNIITGSAMVCPNPVHCGALYTIKVDNYNANAPVHITVMDLSGKAIATYNAGKATVTIPAVKIPGVYLVKISNGGNNYTQKLMVQ
jgi:hypothetical protein